MERIGVRELRQNAREWLRRVQEGKSFEIEGCGRPITLQRANRIRRWTGTLEREAGRIAFLGIQLQTQLGRPTLLTRRFYEERGSAFTPAELAAHLVEGIVMIEATPRILPVAICFAPLIDREPLPVEGENIQGRLQRINVYGYRLSPVTVEHAPHDPAAFGHGYVDWEVGRKLCGQDVHRRLLGRHPRWTARHQTIGESLPGSFRLQQR